MARKASKSPEGESQTESTIIKAEAIRRALAEGLTKSEDALPFIKTRFGHDVTPAHFASAKSREKTPGAPPAKRGLPAGKKKGAIKVKVAAKRGRPPGSGAKRGPKPKAAAAPAVAQGADLLAEMEALKPLVELMGKEKAHRIIDLLG